MIVLLKAFSLWSGILVLAILNGSLREAALIPALGSPAGLFASGMLLSIGVLAVAWTGAPWYGRLARGRWLGVGAFWLLLTLVFEFGFGRIAQHKSWQELFGAYTLQGGNIWPVVLLTTAVAPWLTARFRGLA